MTAKDEAAAVDSVRRLLDLFPDADGLVVDPARDGLVAVSPCCSTSGVVYDGMTLVTSECILAASGVPLYERDERSNGLPEAASGSTP